MSHLSRPNIPDKHRNLSQPVTAVRNLKSQQPKSKFLNFLRTYWCPPVIAELLGYYTSGVLEYVNMSQVSHKSCWDSLVMRNYFPCMHCFSYSYPNFYMSVTKYDVLLFTSFDNWFGGGNVTACRDPQTFKTRLPLSFVQIFFHKIGTSVYFKI